MKVAIKYVGSHQPQEVLEVDHEHAKKLLQRGDYVLVGEQKSFEVVKKKPKVFGGAKRVNNDE